MDKVEGPPLNDIVAITTDGQPWLGVTKVEGDTIEGVLLSDLARETVLRLADAIEDTQQHRKLARILRRADLPTFTPSNSYHDLDPLDLRGAPPFREDEC